MTWLSIQYNHDDAQKSITLILGSKGTKSQLKSQLREIMFRSRDIGQMSNVKRTVQINCMGGGLMYFSLIQHVIKRI